MSNSSGVNCAHSRAHRIMRQLRDKMGLTKDLIKIIDAGGEEGGE